MRNPLLAFAAGWLTALLGVGLIMRPCPAPPAPVAVAAPAVVPKPIISSPRRCRSVGDWFNPEGK